IRKVAHQNTGDAWPIYPMYDFAHSLSDALEGITHSFCTLEFEHRRPLYDWCVDHVDLPNHPDLWQPLVDKGMPTAPSSPRQIEFARGNLSYTVMSKRKLAELVAARRVDGWDDPRMPTLAGVRRRGFPAAAIRTFWERAGLSKQHSVIDFGVLEACVREALDARAPRRMAVLDPLPVTLTNLSTDHAETLVLANHPKDANLGTREVPFSRDLLIERADFAEVPSTGFRRLFPGGEVRLRGVGIVRCDEVVKNGDGRVSELRCTLDPDSREGLPGANRKVKGTIHWVSAPHAFEADVRLYDRLFDTPDPDDESDGRSWLEHLNPDSRRSVRAHLEASLRDAEPEQPFQFERTGYFVADRHDHAREQPVFNRTVSLRDTWSAQRR
ncbi:MAG: glutamate--tRNA ligase family protein, partial [Rhodanobacteraceae bacterium]